MQTRNKAITKEKGIFHFYCVTAFWVFLYSPLTRSQTCLVFSKPVNLFCCRKIKAVWKILVSKWYLRSLPYFKPNYYMMCRIKRSLQDTCNGCGGMNGTTSVPKSIRRCECG